MTRERFPSIFDAATIDRGLVRHAVRLRICKQRRIATRLIGHLYAQAQQLL